jgi:hypothetical protein
LEVYVNKKQFRPGQLVAFNYGSRPMQGIVKEDRGPIGMKGRILYLIEFRSEEQSSQVSHIELPADQLEEVEGAVSSQ